MESAANVKDLLKKLEGALVVDAKGTVTVKAWDAIRRDGADVLAWTVAFGPNDEVKAYASWLIRALALQSGNGPASINEVYLARGRGEIPSTFTIPAINVRAMAYYFCRAILRSCKRHDVGAVLFELSRSEMGYTDQPPEEYASSVLAAALKEGYAYPIFIQGDHFQINAGKFSKAPQPEVDGIKKLTVQSISAGFYNIDIDTSTLVDLAKPTLDEQQKLNYEQCAILAEFCRNHEPKGITISLGGEIGEVGHQNSTVPELQAFLGGFKKRFPSGMAGLSKVSVQTGTSHGGIVLPDGTVAKVKVDFETLRTLGEVARKEFGLAGAVQHGASTLPADFFDRFPEAGTAEIHLATEFQNILYEHPKFPADLKAAIYAHLDKACASERKEGETPNQFYYKTRKKGLGPFKKQLWSLPEATMAELNKALEDRIELLIKKLNVSGTGPVIKKYTRLPATAPAMPAGGKSTAVEAFDGAD